MTHYDEFGVAPTATADEIRRAHRSLARLLHPDQIQDADLRRVAEGQLKRLNAIYTELMDPERRRGYDLQLPARGRRPAHRAAPAWLAPIATAALGLAAGFEYSRWHNGSTAERIVYVERPVAAAAAAPPSKPAEEWRQPSEETRELRRALNQVALERDHALARLAATHPSAPAAPALATVAGTNAVKPVEAAPPRTASAEEPSPGPAALKLSGTWIYLAPAARPAPTDQYPAEYIELVLMERDDALWGRYRARYKVLDRALSPEVEFFFEGPAAGARRYSWRGSGGAKGEIQLQPLSGGALSLNWFTTQLGRTLMLGSGTAVLVRRQD